MPYGLDLGAKVARRLAAQFELRRAVAGVVCAAALGWPSAARADDTADELARRHFDSGAAYLEESDYDNALKAFEKAYELSHRPEILLNIATVQERRGDLAAAISALEQYLQADPNGERAETTRLRLQNLQKRLAESPPAAAAPAAAPQAASPPPAPPPAAAPAPPPEPPPKPNHVPAYIAFGVGGVGLVTAVVTGIVANSKYQDAKTTCSPHCSDAQISSAKSLALVSTIATGVAVVGAGVGLTLFLTSSSSPSASAAPRVRLAFGPGGPRATASFGF
jgi:tetratricopeptide (TPR) repeat protein